MVWTHNGCVAITIHQSHSGDWRQPWCHLRIFIGYLPEPARSRHGSAWSNLSPSSRSRLGKVLTAIFFRGLNLVIQYDFIRLMMWGWYTIRRIELSYKFFSGLGDEHEHWLELFISREKFLGCCQRCDNVRSWQTDHNRQAALMLVANLPAKGWQDTGMVSRQHRNNYPGTRLNIWEPAWNSFASSTLGDPPGLEGFVRDLDMYLIIRKLLNDLRLLLYELHRKLVG